MSRGPRKITIDSRSAPHKLPLMRTVAEFRKHAEECRELAKKQTREGDKKAMELMAEAWEKAANARERELKSK